MWRPSLRCGEMYDINRLSSLRRFLSLWIRDFVWMFKPKFQCSSTIPHLYTSSSPLIRSSFSMNFPHHHWSVALPSGVSRLWRPCAPHAPPCEFPPSSPVLRPKARGDGQELSIPGGGSSHGGSAVRVQRSELSGSSEIECARLVARSHEGQLGPVHSVTPAAQ